MEAQDGRYRGRIVDRQAKVSRDGGSRSFALDIWAEERFDVTTGQWTDLRDQGLILSGGYFITSQGEINTSAIDAFVLATGWDGTEEQFADEDWKPERVQVNLRVKPKTTGKGVWITYTDIVPYDSASGKAGAVGGNVLGDAMRTYRQLKGLPEPTPKPPKPKPIETPVPPTDSAAEIPF